MTAPPPEPTYYSTGRTRRAFLLGGGAALLASAAGLTLWGTGAIGRATATASDGGDGGGPGRGGVSPEAARRQAASPPPSAMADVEEEAIGFTSMAMVGDSITEGSTPALTDVLTKRGVTSLEIRGKTNRRIREGGSGGAPTSGIATLQGMIAEGTRPEVWVIALGTNDVGQYDEDGYRELIDSMLELIDGDRPVVWVDTYRPDRVEDCQLYNRILRERIDRRGNGEVADWFSRASDRDLDLLRKDRLHPNARGQLVFADLVGRALALVAAG